MPHSEPRFVPVRLTRNTPMRNSQATMSKTFPPVMHPSIDQAAARPYRIRIIASELYHVSIYSTCISLTFPSPSSGYLLFISHPHRTQYVSSLPSCSFLIYIFLMWSILSLLSSAKLGPGRQTLKSLFSSSNALQLSLI